MLRRDTIPYVLFEKVADADNSLIAIDSAREGGLAPEPKSVKKHREFDTAEGDNVYSQQIFLALREIGERCGKH